MAKDIKNILGKLKKFNSDRDWDQFHSPKNLACALSVEVAELLEHFQWIPENKSQSLDDETAKAVESEVADIFCYLLLFSDRMGIDIAAATLNKIDINAQRYPVEKAKGTSKKYNKL